MCFPVSEKCFEGGLVCWEDACTNDSCKIPTRLLPAAPLSQAQYQHKLGQGHPGLTAEPLGVSPPMVARALCKSGSTWCLSMPHGSCASAAICRYRTSSEQDEAVIADPAAGPREKVAARLLKLEKSILSGTSAC